MSELTEIVQDRVNRAIDAAFPDGGGGVLTEQRLRTLLEMVAGEAYTQGEHDALKSLMTLEEAAEKIGRSAAALRNAMPRLHARFGIGARFGHVWIVRGSELEQLAPMKRGHRRA